MRILIVGAGHVLRYHLGAIRRRWPDASVSVTDIDPAKANHPDLAGFNAIFVPEAERLAETQKVDLVVVCVPCSEHFAVAKEALRMRKTVLLEKPPTKTVAEFEKLQRIAQTHSALLVCAFHAAYDLTIGRFAAHLPDAKYGKLIGIQSEFSDPYVQDGLVISSLGGSYEDSAPNALSVVARFVDPSRLRLWSAHFSNTAPATTGITCTDSKAQVTYGFPDGTIAIHTDWVTSRNRKVTRLFFRSGISVLLHHSRQIILVGKHNQTEDDMSLLFDCDNGTARLDNHYNGVYDELEQTMDTRMDNSHLGLQITRLWTRAYHRADIIIT